jgi:amidohydrolase
MVLCGIALFSIVVRAWGASEPSLMATRALVERECGDLLELYKHLHANPELSLHEARTATRLAEELSRAGFEVTTDVGGNGVVAVLRNGSSPTVLVRADMDALPVKEQTGLPYASTVKTTNDQGQQVSVMHACGHDMHMTALIGTARVLKELRERWQGTLVMIGQPAEERGPGSKAMLRDGLFTRFPRPDICLALHVGPEVPTGSIGYTEGYALANVDMVNITVRGLGGHGAYPHQTKDPIVLAAELVLSLQTIVSREIPPGESAVVTVGAIHGGTKNNIIPDEVRLQLTVRSYTENVRQQLLAAIKRKALGMAIAAGIPEERMPIIEGGTECTPAVYNDPKLTQRLEGVWRLWFGAEKVQAVKPVMGAEDFSEYGRTAEKVPICIFWLGATDPQALQLANANKTPVPSLHSPLFAPVPEPTLMTGVIAMTAAVLELLGKK